MNATTRAAVAALLGGAAALDMSGQVTVIPGDGAIPLTSGIYVATKGSAAALSLAVPPVNGPPLRITVTAGSNFAHVLTSAGTNIGDGTTGLNTTWTAAAFIGSSITLVSTPSGVAGAAWIVESFNLGTIAP